MIFPAHLLRAQQCTITSYSPTEVVEYGVHIDVAKRGKPHKWEMNLKTPPLTEESARELDTFLDTLDGRYNTFTVNCPVRYMGTVSDAICSYDSVEGDNVVTVDTTHNSEVHAFKVGDYIKFSSHDKVYKLSRSSSTNSSGTAILGIYPALVAAVPANTSIGKAVFTLRSLSDKNGLSMNATKRLYPVSFKAREA